MVVSLAFKVFVLSLPLCAFSCVVFCFVHDVLLRWVMGSGPGPSRRCYVTNSNCFCYICGCYVTRRQKSNITSFVKKAYCAHFKVKLGGLGLHMSCVTRALKD
jgi:hypothetical protein